MGRNEEEYKERGGGRGILIDALEGSLDKFKFFLLSYGVCERACITSIGHSIAIAAEESWRGVINAIQFVLFSISVLFLFLKR